MRKFKIEDGLLLIFRNKRTPWRKFIAVVDKENSGALVCNKCILRRYCDFRLRMEELSICALLEDDIEDDGLYLYFTAP